MKLDREPLLFFNVLLSFAAFLLCFGNACYEYGLSSVQGSEGMGLIIFSLVYLAVLIASIAVFHKEAYSAKPYIVMGAIPLAFIALDWIVYCLADTSATASGTALWFPITLTVLSAIISVLYFIRTYQFYRKDCASTI